MPRKFDHSASVAVAAALTLAFALTLRPSISYAHNYSVVYLFSRGGSGADPAAGLVEDSEGNFYGTTLYGGDFKDGCKKATAQYGCGTVFRISRSGRQSVVYAFEHHGEGGWWPSGGLILDNSGNLYGTTTKTHDKNCIKSACGTIYKISPTGNGSVLHAFQGKSDGSAPVANLIADNAGNLYGTTAAGGGIDCFNGPGCGTVFKLTPGGVETILHAFAGGSDGAIPKANLIADGAGNLYGTTSYGGNSGNSCAFSAGCGTVFKVTPDGTETVLYSFKGGSDGASPISALIADTAGNLYGTTDLGGGTNCFSNFGCGTVFKLTPSGVETVLYAFMGGNDGSAPVAGLVADSSGNFYGTTQLGGIGTNCSYSYGCGTVFKLTPGGMETILHAFAGGSDGALSVCAAHHRQRRKSERHDLRRQA